MTISTTPNNAKRIRHIKRLLRLQGRKQLWLAGQLGISHVILNYILTGTRQPKNLTELLNKAESLLNG